MTPIKDLLCAHYFHFKPFKPSPHSHSDGKFPYHIAAAFSHQSRKEKKSLSSIYTTLPFRSSLGFERKCLCAAHVGTAGTACPLYTAQSSEWINERREWSLRRHRPKGWVPSVRPAGTHRMGWVATRP